MADEDCEGCLTIDRCQDEGNPYYRGKYNIKCPCTICLVKVVCGTPCEDYMAFEAEIYYHNYNQRGSK